MSKNNSEIPRNRSNRTFCTSKPEQKDRNVQKFACMNSSTSFSQRVSMTPSELLQPQTLPRKKKYPLSRQSRLPSQLALDSMKEAEARSKDEELFLLYNEYLQAIMLEHLTKKKSEEMKNTIIKQLTTIAKQCAQDEEKLQKLKMRNRDIINLSIVQEELDSHINEINEYFGSNKISTVNEIMSHLYSVLEPLDQLQCNDIILPEKTEEWLELQKAFKKCENIFENIKELINTNAETYQNVHDGTKDFIILYNDMQSHKQKLDKILHNLQVLTVKYGAYSIK